MAMAGFAHAAPPSMCAITGTLYKPDSSACASCVVTFTPTGSVPQIVNGNPVYPGTVFTTTNASGVLTAISLIQGTSMTVTITDPNGFVSAPVQTSVAMNTGETIGQLLTNNLLAAGVSTVSGFNVGTKTVTFGLSPYTVLATDFFISCDASGGAVVINLPASSGAGRWLHFKKIDATANACTITRAGADTIDDRTTYALTHRYAGVFLNDSIPAQWITAGPLGEQYTGLDLHDNPISNVTDFDATGSIVITANDGGGTNAITGVSVNNAYNVEAFGATGTLVAGTASCASGSSTVTTSTILPIKNGTGLKLKGCGPMAAALNAAPSAPTVTSTSLITGEAQTAAASVNTVSTMTADEMVTYAVSNARFQRLATGAPGPGQYTATAGAPGTYVFGISGMTAANKAVLFSYWTPFGGATSYWYKIAYVDDAGGESPASNATNIANGNSFLGHTSGSNWGDQVNPTYANIVSFTAPNATTQVGTCLYRSTDGNTYTLVTGLPAKDEFNRAVDTYADYGNADRGDLFPAAGTKDSACAATPPASQVADDWTAKVQSGAGTTTLTMKAMTTGTNSATASQTIALAPGTPVFEDDTQSFYDAIKQAEVVVGGDQGGSTVDVPSVITIRQFNKLHDPDNLIATGAKLLGISFEGRSFRQRSNSTIYGTGPGGGQCSLTTGGIIQAWGATNWHNLNFATQPSTVSSSYEGMNSIATCYFNVANGGGADPNIGVYQSAFGVSPNHAPNITWLWLDRMIKLRLQDVTFGMGKHDITNPVGYVNSGYILGGQPSQSEQPREYLFDFNGPIGLEMIGPTFENGPNMVRIRSASTFSNNSLRGGYYADILNQVNTQGVNLGDEVPIACGTVPGTASSCLGFIVDGILLAKGKNQIVLSGAGITVQNATIQGEATGSYTACDVTIMDALSGATKTQTSIHDNIMYASVASICDKATTGYQEIYHNEYPTPAGTNSIDFSVATDSGFLRYNSSLDASTNGIKDTASATGKDPTALLLPTGWAAQLMIAGTLPKTLSGQQWTGSSGTTAFDAAAARYMPITGFGLSATETDEQATIARAATIRRLSCKVSAAPGAAASGKSYAFKLRDNVGDTTLTCTILETATTCTDTTHFPLAATGHLFDISVTPANTPNAATGTCAVEVDS